MGHIHWNQKPNIGVLAGWQFYRTATNLSYLKPVFSGINQAAHDFGCNVLFGCGMGASASPADPIRPAWPVPDPGVDFVPIGPENTDGLLIFSPLHSSGRSQFVQNLITSGHPVLFIGSGEPGPTIVADNAAGIFEAVQHLAGHGHRQVAFLAGSPDDLQGDTGDRLRAYQAAIARYELENDPQIVAFGRHVYDGGYAATRQILDAGAPFTAVLASNDESALGAMQALEDAGCKVPQDVAVIGFDNRLEGAAHTPGLTSIHVPLFSMGYRALQLLFEQIYNGTALEGVYKVSTHLVVRVSCGCGEQAGSRISSYEQDTGLPEIDRTARRLRLAQAISAAILSQSQGIAEQECLTSSRRLVDAYFNELMGRERSGFQAALAEILQGTMSGEDEANIWQNAISLLSEEVAGHPALYQEQDLAMEMLDEARQRISAGMQQQYRQYAANQRWTSSRLSLLTAALFSALDEEQIWKVLAQHLREMDIDPALIVLFDPQQGSDSFAYSVVRDTINLTRPAIRYPSLEFPPPGLLNGESHSTLALIPLVGQDGQLGFAVFGTDHFDLYGAVVQQIAGALNTARLYRQAMEGQRLAEEANRMKSRFLSTISHELRTPLNLILGLSEMVLKESDESETLIPDSTRRDVERIHAYSQHLGGLIGDVIDLATSDAGQLRLNNEYIDLRKTLRIVAESGRQLASDKGLEWEAVLPESGPWVLGDQTRLRQIVLNLINNAIKFTEHGRVRLRIATMGDLAHVSVSDTGLGISPEEQQVIFDEFRQSDRTVSHGYGGLGLGLAICKRLVEMQGGKIGVHSSGEEGAGSTFYFTLPLVTPPAGHATKTGVNTIEQNVLVLTNDPGTSERLRENLSERGFKVQIDFMNRLPVLLSLFDNFQPEAIVLDVSTGSDMGWDALRAIKTNQMMRNIPVLFYTASQDEGALLELDYLTKPIEMSELTSALDQQWLMTSTKQDHRTILVVDDDPDTLELHAQIVQSHSSSNRILLAHHGREALEILEREVVDLLLLDLQMPELDGFGVLERMREKESMREIPVIVVTGKMLTEEDMARLNHGVTAVLGKGLFNINETVAHISTALERKRRLSGEAQRLIRNAMAYLHEHYAERMSRADLARHVGITEDYLTFCFRQELGTTIIEYLQRYRIHRAKELLKSSQDTITKIALDVGFSDSGYFSRIFRRETGLSPSEYRRS